MPVRLAVAQYENTDRYQQDSKPDEKSGTHHQRRNDADRDIALWIARLLGRRGNQIESDVSKKDDGPAGKHSRPAIGKKWTIVLWIHEMRSHYDESQDGRD